jgi:hypothetical protein
MPKKYTCRIFWPHTEKSIRNIALKIWTVPLLALKTLEDWIIYSIFRWNSCTNRNIFWNTTPFCQRHAIPSIVDICLAKSLTLCRLDESRNYTFLCRVLFSISISKKTSSYPKLPSSRWKTQSVREGEIGLWDSGNTREREMRGRQTCMFR